MKYESKFVRNDSFRGFHGAEYYGPFDYKSDDDASVEVTCDVIEILESWGCDYEWFEDENGMSWLKTRTGYEEGSIIEEMFSELNGEEAQAN